MVAGADANSKAALGKYIDDCAARSVDAFDKLLSVTEYAEAGRMVVRNDLRLVPNAAETAAALFALYPRISVILDMTTGQPVSMPAEVGRQMYGPVAWTRSSSEVAFFVTRHDDQEDVQLIVVNVPLGRIVLDLAVGSRPESIAWNGVGNELAVLQSRSREGKGLLERLGASIGHGVSYYDFRLSIISVPSGVSRAVTIATDVESGVGTVMWDGKCITSMARDALRGRVTGKGR